MRPRRALLVLAACLAASACGFRPLYLPAAAGNAGAASDLAAVSVDVMPERTGQLLRQALQARLEGSGGVAQRFTLSAGLVVSGEGIGVLPDNSVTRVRLIGNANWYLRAADPARTLVTSGSARASDGYNVINQQYFFADLSNDATQRRIVEVIADQITLQLAAWFRSARQPDDQLYVMCASAAFYADAGQDPVYPYLWFVEVQKVPGAITELRTLLSSEARAPRFIAFYQNPDACDPSGATTAILETRYHLAVVVAGVAVLERIGA